MRNNWWLKGSSSLIVGAFAATIFYVGARAQISPGYTPAQATAGKAAYAQNCQACHGAALDDGEFAPALKGGDFLAHWGGQPVGNLGDYIHDNMPKGSPGSLSEDNYINIMAYILQANAISPAQNNLTAENARQMSLPGHVGGLSVLAPNVKLPPNPTPVANPLDKITPVSEAMLASPPDGDWLSWRRTRDGSGFSPLKQITKANVKSLVPVWSWSLPVGPAEATPLVHDGVMFLAGYRDVIQAFNAANGDLLWQYTRRLPKGVSSSVKKSVAILGNLLFSGTSDGHLIALDVKTGNVKWDTNLGQEAGVSVGTDSGPIIAKGNVILGSRGGHPFIVAVNAQTGKEVWRFGTIAKDGKEGDSWNGMPYEKRTGGTVWVPGSYDETTKLVYFGTAQTYDTGPLARKIKGGNNDALYMDTTLALNPETGKLAWYFQHLPNDQWDHDWVFERILFNSGGKRLVATAGKQAVYDVLDATTGKFAYSFDPGLQNIILSVDPKTGAKKINPDTLPGDGKVHFICPSTAGAKNLMPAAYNPGTHVLVTQLTEACADFVPVEPGVRGVLSTGIRQNVRPRLDGDGNYGRLEAFDLPTGKVLWKVRQRASFQSGVLAVDGVVFVGDIDRNFSAYDDATGQKLWNVRLNDASNGTPVTYSVNGKQYVAVVTGTGGTHSVDFDNLYPEIKTPPTRTETLEVFALPAPQ